MMTKMSIARWALIAVILAVGIAPARAANPPRELKWAELVPPNSVRPPPKNRTFFAGSEKASDDESAPPQALPEGKFMSMKRRQPGGDRPPAVVTDLDGQRIKIGGYVVPLDFEATAVKEFLLVPFVGACIHVPPPPANQIIYVKAEKGIEITGPFDPVSVVGTMKTETASTGLADAGYTLAAETIDIIEQ